MPSALSADELDGVVPANPARESFVEGLDAPVTLGTTAGAIHADFEGDRVRIEVEPSDARRFLVVNEVYNPGWHAYASTPEGTTALTVWPTNIVMRGILVPPGVSQIEMRFEPFMTGWLAKGLAGTGLVMGIAGWVALRRFDSAPASRGAPVPSPVPFSTSVGGGLGGWAS